MMNNTNAMAQWLRPGRTYGLPVAGVPPQPQGTTYGLPVGGGGVPPQRPGQTYGLPIAPITPGVPYGPTSVTAPITRPPAPTAAPFTGPYESGGPGTLRSRVMNAPIPPWERARQLREQLEPMVRDPRNGNMGYQRAKQIFDVEMAKAIEAFRAAVQQGNGLGILGRR